MTGLSMRIQIAHKGIYTNFVFDTKHESKADTKHYTKNGTTNYTLNGTTNDTKN